MSSPAPSAAYREAAGWITPADLSTYLASTPPWQLEARQDDVREIWTLPGPYGRLQARIMLPLATDYADFSDRFSDAIAAVGHIYDWQPSELADHLLAIRADLLHVRLGQAHSSETIPLQQADTTISAIYEMVTEAAASAAPEASDDDQPAGDLVRTFLQEELRLAHTRQGSFIFTVVAQQNQASAIDLNDVRTEPGVPFSRQVMQTLATNLETAYRLTKARDLQALASLAALEPLRRLVGSGDLRSVEFSFEWAAAIPPPDVGSAPLQLDLDDVQELRDSIVVSVIPPNLDAEGEPHAAPERPQAGPEPLPRETLTGFVVELKRWSPRRADDVGGSALREAEASDGAYRRIRGSLAGEADRIAIPADAQSVPIVITGDLIVRPRVSRLGGDLEITGPFTR